MSEGFVSRGFGGRRRNQDTALPPGQYLVDGFPVLSAGPTPHTPLEEWDFTIEGEVDEPRRRTWEEFRQLPSEEISRDIHCVTKWSKLGTTWEGVSVDTLLEGVETAAEYVTAFCDGGYTTNLPLEDVTGGKAWVAFAYEGEPLEPIHGGPARLLVPHLYFWKSAKWLRGLQLTTYDMPGFWESLGYHNHGDPWREQRYWGDQRVPETRTKGKPHRRIAWRLGEVIELIPETPRSKSPRLGVPDWGERPLIFVCGPTPLVEAVATAPVDLRRDPTRVKTERFGPTGGQRAMDDRLRLDGNSAAGSLGEIFSFEATTAQFACEGCGRADRIGAAMVYEVRDLGIIIRCPSCDNALIRLAHNRGRHWIDLRGIRYLQVEDVAE